MVPSCTWQTFCGFFLAAFGAAVGWGMGLFVVAQVTRAIVRLFGIN
jgi:hypothetical protein